LPCWDVADAGSTQTLKQSSEHAPFDEGRRGGALRITIDSAVAFLRRIHRGQKIRYWHSGVQHLNQISGSDALALGYVQQFNDSAFHQFGLGLCGLSKPFHHCSNNVSEFEDFAGTI
jgi:hypothetical protein